MDPIKEIYELLRRLAPTLLPPWEEVDRHRYTMKVYYPQRVEIFFQESITVEQLVMMWSALHIKFPRKSLKGIWFEIQAIRIDPTSVPELSPPIVEPSASNEPGPQSPDPSPQDEPTAEDLVEDVDDDVLKKRIEADFQELLEEFGGDTDA